ARLVSDYIHDHEITIALLPPALVSVMTPDPLVSLKTLLVGGDLTALELMRKWSKNRQLINAYGPTENTVCATMHFYQEGDHNTIIGKPLDNMQVYVLDPGP